MARGLAGRRIGWWAAPLALLLAGCTTTATPTPSASSQSPTTTLGPTESASPTGSTTDPSATVTTGTASGTPTAPPSPVALPTAFVPVNQVIKDPDLGHEVKVNRIVRALPWPDGYAASAAAYELVGVEMTWTPGVTYTAALRQVDFSLVTGSQFPNRPDPLIDPLLSAAAWPLLPATLPNGQSATGWLVFKVDPKDATTMRLDYTRPASRVTDTGQTFAKTVFSAPVVGAAPVPSTPTG